MKKTLHIIAGDCARGSLIQYLRGRKIEDGNDILCFEDDLSQGSLFKDFSKEELRKRAALMAKLFGDYYFTEDRFYDDLYAFIHFDFDRYDQIVIWHGNVIREQMLLCLVCALLPNRGLYEVDVSLIRSYRPGTWSLAICSFKEVDFLFPQIARMSAERQKAYVAVWQMLCESEADLRIWENNTIREVPADYYDELILSLCGGEFQPSARIVGHALANCDQHIGDSFFIERLLHLAEKGKLTLCAKPPRRIVQGVDVSFPALYQVKLNK